MPDHQELVDSIRAFLAQSDQTLTDGVRTLASDFAEVCRAADGRLRRCEDYLRRGLISEAIHLAEVAPPVLEVVAVLDFPDRAQWEELANLYNLPPAPRVNIDRAATLNQAYPLHQTLEPLLREHRRLALMRAPLHERLAVLRQLAVTDPGNALWQDDIREFETATQSEIVSLCEEAHRRQDTVLLTTLVQQVENSNWLVPPPPALLHRLRQLLQTAEEAQAREKLPDIVRGLEKATRKGDVDGAQALLRAADEELARARVPPNDVALSPIHRARAWVEERLRERQAQADFELALASFVGLLDAHVRFDRLQDAWADLRRHRRAIPQAIQDRYRQVRDEQKAVEREKTLYWNQVVNGTVLAIAAPIVTGILIVVIIVLYRMILSG